MPLDTSAVASHGYGRMRRVGSLQGYEAYWFWLLLVHEHDRRLPGGSSSATKPALPIPSNAFGRGFRDRAVALVYLPPPARFETFLPSRFGVAADCANTFWQAGNFDSTQSPIGRLCEPDLRQRGFTASARNVLFGEPASRQRGFTASA